MTDIRRICPSCDQSAPLDSRYCPACGHDAQTGYTMVPKASLPAAIGRAALPVLAGAATIALRFGWQLLSNRLAAPAQARTDPPTQRPQADIARSERPQRRIRIRSTWAVGDHNGNWRQGASEHIIDLDG